jgi:hypothetical protein
VVYDDVVAVKPFQADAFKMLKRLHTKLLILFRRNFDWVERRGSRPPSPAYEVAHTVQAK